MKGRSVLPDQYAAPLWKDEGQEIAEALNSDNLDSGEDELGLEGQPAPGFGSILALHKRYFVALLVVDKVLADRPDRAAPDFYTPVLAAFQMYKRTIIG